MKTRRGWVQGYNARALVTPGQIVLAADVTTEPNDVRQLTGMLDQAQANVEAVVGEGAVLGAAVADAGYWSQAAPTVKPKNVRCSSRRGRITSSGPRCVTRGPRGANAETADRP
jgi:hypothetical protein